MKLDKRRRQRLVSPEKLSKDQALWLCRAILTHYSQARSGGVSEEDFLEIISRISRNSTVHRGKDWSGQAVGYNLEETWYGNEFAGIWEAWATLVALGVGRVTNSPRHHRFYKAIGMVEGYDFKISVFHKTEIYSIADDDNFHKYVGDCLQQLVSAVDEFPERYTLPEERLFKKLGRDIKDV